jgi:two-component system chemotaxis sensor kinase CheA
LVTNRTRLLQIENMLRIQYGQDSNVAALSVMIPHFSHVIDQLHEEVMRARMLPIASLFNKMPRLVRDAARKAGKQVDLSIEGEATELDRAVIEAIGDPLIHLLRNAVDHGIETSEVRQAAGKAPTGVIHLAAASVEGQIVITVSDDGQGIDPDRIYQAASGRGLLPESSGETTPLSEDEIIDLIFQPNLSTATKITEMSGRGVGLDVVRTNIERLSGSVVVLSERGQGTTFELTLPLTLALVQTMLVSVHNTLYAVPVTGINGAMYLAEAPLSTVKGKPTLDWQGTTVPLLDLREYFAGSHLTTEQSGSSGQNGLKPSVVLVNWGKHRVGLAVDKIIGQQEIVVKSLSPLVGRPVGVSGATILGDGQVALIVDIPGLINAAMQLRRQREK